MEDHEEVQTASPDIQHLQAPQQQASRSKLDIPETPDQWSPSYSSHTISSAGTEGQEKLINISPASTYKTDFEFNRIKKAEFSSAILALFGFFWGAISYDISFSEEKDTLDEQHDFLLVVCTISTLLLLCSVVWKHTSVLRWQKAWGIFAKEHNLYSAGRMWYVALELLVNLVHPTLWTKDNVVTVKNDVYDVNVDYGLNSILWIIMLIRAYHIFRAAIIGNLYFSTRAQRVCAMNGATASMSFSLKWMIADGPFDFIGLSCLLSIFMGGFALRIFERPLFEHSALDFSSYGNAMWTVILTMTTVGYGDYYPVTVAGRVIGFIVCIWGICSVALMVTSSILFLKLNQSEEKSYAVLQRIEFKQQLEQLAANVLQSAYRYRRMLYKNPHDQKKHDHQLGKLKFNLKEFATARNKKRILYNYDCEEDKIMNSLETVWEKNCELIVEIDDLTEYVDSLINKL